MSVRFGGRGTLTDEVLVLAPVRYSAGEDEQQDPGDDSGHQKRAQTSEPVAENIRFPPDTNAAPLPSGAAFAVG
jgi:hypothetical protein